MRNNSNGIWGGDEPGDDNAASVDALRSFASDLEGIEPGDADQFEFEPAFTKGNNIMDLYEIAVLKFTETLSAQFLISDPWDSLEVMQAYTDVGENKILAPIQRAVLGARVSIYNSATELVAQTVEDQALQYKTLLLDNQRVFVVAHSEGTLLANAVKQFLAQDPTVADKLDSIRILHVASLANHVEDADPGAYVTDSYDQSVGLVDIPGNVLPPNATNGDIDNLWYAFSDFGAWKSDGRQWALGSLGHGFATFYMQPGSETRGMILEKLLEQVRTTPYLCAEDPVVTTGVLEVWVRDLYYLPGVADVRSYVVNLGTGGELVGENPHTPDSPRHSYVVESGTYIAILYARKANGQTVFKAQKRFEITDDAKPLWDPTVQLTPNIKPDYMGLQEDCAPLQGTYTLDVNGVFDGAAPNFPLANENIGLMLNDDEGLTYNLFEREKISNDPLTIYGEIFPSCNLPEDTYKLSMVYAYFEASDGDGFWASFGDTFDNLDNRFPGRVWNSTDLSPFPECPPFAVTISVDGNGDPTQSYAASPGSAVDGFIRLGYQYDFRYYEGGQLVSQNPIATPPYEQGGLIVDRLTYRNETAWWFHHLRITSCTQLAGGNDLKATGDNDSGGESVGSTLINLQPPSNFENTALELREPFDLSP